MQPASAQDVSLVSAAKQLGFTFTWVGGQDAVQLTRPGVTIVIRPGKRLFVVNERTETADVAPHTYKNEFYVSDSFVSQLRSIAQTYPLLKPAHHALQSTSQAVAPGSIMLDDVHQIDGTYELSVSGDAPSHAPIILTEKEIFSTEIPATTLQTVDVVADENGHFSARVPAAPGYFRGGIVTIVASSSAPGVSDSSSRLVLKAPNANVSVPAEQEPKSVR
jgi:hypothetical protein